MITAEEATREKIVQYQKEEIEKKREEAKANSITLCENEVNNFIKNQMKNGKEINVGIKIKTKVDKNGNTLFNLITLSNEIPIYGVDQKIEYRHVGNINYDLETFISYLKKNGYKVNTYSSSYLNYKIIFDDNSSSSCFSDNCICTAIHIYVEIGTSFNDTKYMELYD